MSSTTLVPCKACLHHPVYLSSIIGIVTGMFCLTGGSCVILLWAFTPGFAQSHPIALKVSAIICTLGVITVLCSVICMYCYHVKLRKTLCSNRCVHYSCSNMHQQDSLHPENYYKHRPTPSSSSMPDAINLNGLRKNKSAAFVSLGSLQLETYEVLGVLRNGNSNTDTIGTDTRKHRSTTDSEDIKQNIMFLDDTFGDSGQRPKLYFRPASKSTQMFHSSDKAFPHVSKLQGSLPRIYLQRLSEKDSVMLNNGDSIPLNVRRTRSDRVKSGGLSQPVLTTSTETSNKSQPNDMGQSSAKSMRPRNDDRNDDRDEDDDDREMGDPISPLPRVSNTPPVGQASLFNLDSTDYGNLILRTSTTSAVMTQKLKDNNQSSSAGEQAASSKRLVLMRESGHVLSCTTLFDDEEESNGNNCRRVQACPGWNIFPVYLKKDKSDNFGTSDEETIEAPRLCLDPTASATGTDLEASIQVPKIDVQLQTSKPAGRFTGPIRSLFRHMKSAVKRRWGGHQDPGGRLNHSEVGEKLLGERWTEKIPTERHKSHSRTSATDTLDQTSSFPQPLLGDNKPNDLDSTIHNESAKARKHAVITNASVFSLPAIPPALWSAERPVWIMGLPADDYSTDKWFTVDPNDIILLRKESQEMKYVSGSSSSIYAFHVKPPPRLKPTAARVRHQHGRARSLGHMLTMDKSILQKET